MVDQRPPIVLVAGGYLGPWIWDEVVARLTAGGHEVTAVPLPSIPADDVAEVGDLHDDVAAVRAVLDGLRAPAVLCGHSYGGVVITQAAAGPHPQVAHLVYLAAAAPDAGQALAELAPSGAGHDPAEARTGQSADEGGVEQVTTGGDGTRRLDPASAATSLFADAGPDATALALSRLQRMNLEVHDQPVTVAAWREIAATYVRATDDPLPERLAPGFLDTVAAIEELPAGHCPQLTRPDLVADLLDRCATAVTTPA